MAKYVGAKSEARWNYAAKYAEANSAGNHFVPGMYREPRRGAAGCEDLPAPGSYPAIAGASIAAGATGSVVYDGVVYQAKNQSQCNVVIGDLVGLHVSPTCEIFFVPCVCDCAQTTPTDCCDAVIAICINGQVRIVAVDGGTASWDLSSCCDCEGATFSITLSCTPGSGQGPGNGPGPGGNSVTTATWVYTCGEGTDTGTFDLSGLCDDPVVEYDDTITMRGCDVQIIATTDATNCDACEAPPEPDPPIDTDCCENAVPETLWLEINGVSYAMVYDGEDWVYEGPIAGCATSVIFKVRCLDGTFGLGAFNSGNNCSFEVDSQTLVSCSPFELDVTFNVTDLSGNCPCVGAETGKVTA